MHVLNLTDTLHEIRISKMGLSLAHLLKLSSSDEKVLYNSCLFHDIGKSYLDQGILNRPGVLTEKERNHIQKHCFYGCKIIRGIGFTEEIALSVLYHHENFDGSGYPFGIKGAQIPFSSRIIRILDTFDALVSDRPYRKKVGVGEALTIMEQESAFFDPDLFRLFSNNLDLLLNFQEIPPFAFILSS